MEDLKMKKKTILALFLALVMLVGTVGCAATAQTSGSTTQAATVTSTTAVAESTGTTAASTSSYPAASELKPHKIGVMWYSYSDQLGGSIKKNLEYLGKEFNVEFTFVEAYLPEDAVAATENLIQNGVEGIMSLTIYPDMIKQCEKAGVYLSQFSNETTDADMLKMIADSKYFVGMINENDEACGEAMVDDLYARGCRNIVWISIAAGAASNHDNRVRGIETAVKKYPDLKVLANYRGDKVGEALQSFAVTYPDMDGIIATGGAGGGTEEFYQIMSSEGLTDRGVIFATIDIGEGTGERLASGDLGWIGGGQFPTSGIAFSLIYNAITGNKILENPEKALYRNFLILQSEEDYNNYVKFVAGSIPPYTGNEIKALIKAFNPDASIELYNQYNSNYSIKDIVARHADFIK
jgi:ABC-type sugar transport system substrate-binding protein